MTLFSTGSQTYKSDIILGERYKDKSTGIEGEATAVYFFKHACERVALRYAHDGEIKEATFDAPEIELVETGETPRSERPGGPDRGPARRADVQRR